MSQHQPRGEKIRPQLASTFYEKVVKVKADVAAIP
jgi:hypothetical protein